MQNTSNTGSTTPPLPQELFREILDHLEGDKPSLCAVSLSSTILRQEAQRMLFREVTTMDEESRLAKFLLTVAGSAARLALLVRAYSITIVGISRDLSAPINEALRAMCNLKYLGVYCAERTKVQSPATVLRGCTFKLERFEWMSPPSEAPELIKTFLRGQDKITQMTIKFLHPTLSLEPILRPVESTVGICPQLVSLVANWDVIQILLSGHKIASMTVLDSLNRPSSNIDINSLAPALKHIKSLSHPFYSVYEEEPTPEHFLPHCTSLAVLELGRLDDVQNFAVLLRVPTLHTLVLSRSLLPDTPLQQEETTELVRRIFDNSGANLQKIDVQLDMEIYGRYMRSRVEGAAIPRASRSEVTQLFPK